VEGEFGTIETITSIMSSPAVGFAGMILPLTYFIEKPFQNWTTRTPICWARSSCMSTIRSVERLRQQLGPDRHDSNYGTARWPFSRSPTRRHNMVELRALVSGATPISCGLAARCREAIGSCRPNVREPCARTLRIRRRRACGPAEHHAHRGLPHRLPPIRDALM